MLHSVSQWSWKTHQQPQDWKRSVFLLIPKKGNAKECSNYHKFALISCVSKIMLKILQARLQQYVNLELPGVQAGFRKDRDITLPIEVRIVIALVFPLVMYRCDCWIIKKAGHCRIDAFKLWCWRRLFRVSWTTRRSNQSILKEFNPEYSLEGLMPELQYFGHLMQSVYSLGKTPMLAKIESKRRRLLKRMRWLASLTQWTWIWTCPRR